MHIQPETPLIRRCAVIFCICFSLTVSMEGYCAYCVCRSLTFPLQLDGPVIVVWALYVVSLKLRTAVRSTEIEYFAPQASSPSSGCQCDGFLGGFCPWLADGHLLHVSPHGFPFVSMF